MADAAFPGPYTDPNITYRNLSHVEVTPTPAYKDDPSLVDVYDVAGRVTSGFSHTDAPDQSPNHWVPGRDPYKVDGMVGQDTFKNQA